MNPEFFHIETHQIPTWTEGTTQFKLIAGKVMGHQSPVPVYSPMYMLEIKSEERQSLALGDHLFGESGLYILEGGIESEGNRFGPKQILVAKESSLCEFTIEANSTIYIFGGESFPEERFIDWNFVATSKDTLAAARQKWKNQEFDKIPGDSEEFVPYPSIQGKK